MRKIFLLATVAALAACGGNATKKAENKDAKQTQPETHAQTAGSYTAMRAVTAEDKAVFDEAMRGFAGVTYTPDSVATQVVNGTNYKFLCQARTATREPMTFRAEVIVYKPLPQSGGQAVITSIVRLSEPQAAAGAKAKTAAAAKAPAANSAEGAYTAMHALTSEDKTVFDQAMKGIVGVTYTPDSVATQVVNGTNYKFLCKAETMTNPPMKFDAEVIVYRPLPQTGDEPVVTEIRRIK